jgi:hypothetical protein
MATYQPGARDVHIDRLLTNISVAYKNEEYIADQVFPTVMVEKQSDLIPTYDKADWLRAVVQPYVPGTKGARSGYRVGNLTYFCRGWKLGKEIPDDVKANADEPFDLKRDSTAWLREQMQLRWELEFANNFFANGVWQDKDGGTDFVKWSNYAGSNPITDIRTLGDLIRTKTGRQYNTLVISKRVWDVLIDHPMVVDRLKYTSKESITPEMFARLTGYQKTLIGSAIQVTSQEDAASPTIAEVFGDHALILHVPPKPGLLTPAAGYTFVWRPITSTPHFIRQLRNEEEEKDIIEIKSYFDIRKLDADQGVFLETAI